MGKRQELWHSRTPNDIVTTKGRQGYLNFWAEDKHKYGRLILSIRT